MKIEIEHEAGIVNVEVADNAYSEMTFLGIVIRL
jgi:hypothetical protein